MILGTGIDIVEVERIHAVLDKYGESFEQKVFSLAEQTYCTKQARPAIHFAARFAAKEAFVKAINAATKSDVAISLCDVEVARAQTGIPNIVCHGSARSALQKSNAHKVHVSLSHTHEQAVAMVILEGKLIKPTDLHPFSQRKRKQLLHGKGIKSKAERS